MIVPQLRSIVRGVTASYEAKALLRSATLLPILATAIEKKLEAEQQSEQMKFVLNKETQEADRKRIEATSKLADSQNSKVVVIGSGKDGLPIILGGPN